MQTLGTDRFAVVATAVSSQMGRSAGRTLELQEAILDEGADVAGLEVGVQLVGTGRGTQPANSP